MFGSAKRAKRAKLYSPSFVGFDAAEKYGKMNRVHGNDRMGAFITLLGYFRSVSLSVHGKSLEYFPTYNDQYIISSALFHFGSLISIYAVKYMSI